MSKTAKRPFWLCISVLTAIFIFCMPMTANATSTDTAVSSFTMKYDDYFSDFEYTDVEILKKGKPVSFKVGYEVSDGTPDDAVVSVEKGVLHATGVGKARVKLDGKAYDVTVEKADISMFLLIGQSNMYGTDGKAEQSVANKDGTVYSTSGQSSRLSVKNAAEFVPSALSGDGALVTAEGEKTRCLSDNPVNRLTESGDGKTGMDGALAYKWHEMTGDKVWLVNAAHGGTVVSSWRKDAKQYNEAVKIFRYAQQVMRKEILAGHYTLRDYGCFWLQGCSDRPNTAEYYIENFLSMYNGLKKELLFDIDGDGTSEVLNFFDIIIPRFGRGDSVGYRRGIYTKPGGKNFYQSFKDLEMNGPRVAQYWLVNNPSYGDINLVCNIGDSWVTSPDGSDGVKEYFAQRYPGGKLNYPVQQAQKKDWYYPDSPSDVHKTIHYSQRGYNELGFESAENAVYTHGRLPKPADVETTVSFYDWTGFRKLNVMAPSTWKDSDSLAVPVVYPVYESKNVSYTLSDNLKYEYYDLVAEYGSENGSVTAVGCDEPAELKVIGAAKYKKGGNHYLWKATDKGLVQQSEYDFPVNNVSIAKIKGELGTVNNKKHNKVIYRLERSVNLLHGNAWSVEWSGRPTDGNSDFMQMLLSENIYINKNKSGNINYILHLSDKKSDELCVDVGKTVVGTDEMANSHTSLKHKCDKTCDGHVYRLYNVLSADGKNMVNLSVDGVYCGSLFDVSGVDFTFRFIGAKGYEIDDFILDYLEVYEDSHSRVYSHNCTLRTDSKKMGTKTVVCNNCDYIKKEYIN